MSITEASVSDRPLSVRERINILARGDKARMKRSRLDDGAVPNARVERREIEWPDKQIADTEGGIGSPYRAVDVLARLLNNGSITLDMQAAGWNFQDDFDKAGLEQLRAADMGRVSVSGSKAPPIAEARLAARQRVWEAVKMLGGLSSPAGSCVLDVLGFRDTVSEWALREARHKRIVSGILIGALGALVEHYGIGERKTKNITAQD